MSDGMTDEDLTGYARIHCRTERALFHASHIRRLLELAGRKIPAELLNSNGFYGVHEDVMDPILADIETHKKQPKLTVLPGGKA